MRHRVLYLVPACVAVVACAKKENAPADTTPPAAATAPPPPAAALSLADVAGKWNFRAVPDSGDTTATTYVLTADPDSTKWTLKFQNGLTVPAHVMASGDSIILHSGPYASVRRKGVQVTTETVLRRQGDKLAGTTVAHYKTTKPDSVLHLHNEGTKAP
jgi:hypothetical protein